MTTWKMFESMKEIMGAEELLEELARALSTDELKENLAYIMRNHDIELEDF